MNLIGYTDRWSIRAGESVTAHVSLAEAGPVEADLVRIVRGAGADGFGVGSTPVGLSGTYPCGPQETRSGSCAIVAATGPLDTLAAFSLTVAVCPTLPEAGRQVLVAGFDEATGRGFQLAIEDGRPTLASGDGSGQRWRLCGKVCFARGVWRLVRVEVAPVGLRLDVMLPDGTPVETVASDDARFGPATGPWCFAASIDADARPCCCFNGKLEGPTVRDRSGIVADWTFAGDFASDAFDDRGPHRLNGRFVNAPVRAVTGMSWSGRTGDWREAPHDYAAVHFHEDDLDDAGWSPAFTWRIPASVDPGVYAIRLRARQDEHFLPLFVARALGAPARRLAVLFPTATYLAYGNDHQAFDKPHPERSLGRPIALQPQDLYLHRHRELGLSHYDTHADGSGVVHASLRRPLLNQRPGTRRWDGADGFGQRWLGLDLALVEWLERHSLDFDVVTDEMLDRDAADALEGIGVLLTGSQPEYTSTAMLDGLEAWIGRGGRLVYLGGNGFYWRVAYGRSAPWRLELRRGFDGAGPWVSAPGEAHLANTGEQGGSWRTLGRPPQRLVGVGFVAEGFTRSGPYRRTRESDDSRWAFVFEGIAGETFGMQGLAGGGAAGIELDRARPGLGTPDATVILARADLPSVFYQACVLEERHPLPAREGTGLDLGADMTISVRPSGGVVFATGSIAWIGALNAGPAGRESDASLVTWNVIGRFLDKRPFT